MSWYITGSVWYNHYESFIIKTSPKKICGVPRKDIVTNSKKFQKKVQ